jgi:hypothetical protein
VQQPTAAGHQSALDLRNAERRVRRGHDQVRGQRQLGAAGQREPLDRRDQRLDRRLLVEAHAAAFDNDVLTAGEGLEVQARAKRAAGAGQHPERQTRVVVQLVHRVGESSTHRGGHRVLGFRTVDGDQ